MFLQSIAVDLFDCPGYAAVDLLSSLFEQTLVCHLLGERMFEDVFQLRIEGFFIKYFQSHEVGQLGPQIFSQFHNALENPIREISADHACNLHGSLEVLVQAVHSGCQNSLNSIRNP